MAWTVIFQINVRNCIGLNIKLLTDNIGFCIQMKKSLITQNDEGNRISFLPFINLFMWKIKTKLLLGKLFVFYECQQINHLKCDSVKIRKRLFVWRMKLETDVMCWDLHFKCSLSCSLSLNPNQLWHYQTWGLFLKSDLIQILNNLLQEIIIEFI